MFYYFKNLKINFRALSILTVLAVSLPINLIHAQTINVIDAEVRGNTRTLITNTNTIISKNSTIITNLENISKQLAGTLPGAQQDNIKAREDLFQIKLLLKQMVDKTIVWVNTGFSGNPAYIVNTGAYLQDGTDQTINYFVTQDSALDSACNPTEIKTNIGLQYDTFRNQIGCSVDIGQRQTFLEGDFIGGGGWDTWLKITTEPKNSPMGALVIAQGELNARISDKKTQDTLEANWGDGFMSWKDCNGQPNTDRGYDGCSIKTPGSVIAAKLNWALTSPLRELEVAVDYNSLVYILGPALSKYKKIEALGGAGLRNNTRTNNNIGTSYTEYMNYVNNLSSSNNPYNPDGSVDFTGALTNIDKAYRSIDLQIIIENDYLAAQLNIKNFLTTTKEIFTDLTCKKSSTNTEILTNVFIPIVGTTTPNKPLIWDLTDVDAAITVTNNNKTYLNEKALILAADPTNVSLAAGIITDIITRNTWHTRDQVNDFTQSEEVNTFNQIQNWIVGKINTYNNACTIDKSTLAEWGIMSN